MIYDLYIYGLGVVFNNNLTLETHFSNLSRTLYYEFRRISQLSRFLTKTSLKTLLLAFIMTRIDYCNSLFVNLPDDSLKLLQRFQNRAAKMVLGGRKSDHVTPLLISLHWLPVKARVTYKIALLAFRIIHGMAPQYLKELIELYTPSRSLRSGTQCLLRVPKRSSVRLADRSFAHAAPSVWNSLPIEIRSIKNEDSFRSQLKTHLFRIHLLK